MARRKRATPRTGMLLDANATRLPLALKPSNSSESSSSSCTNESLSPITANTDTNSTLYSISGPPSSLPSSTENKSSSSTGKMKKTKSQCKAVIVESNVDAEDTDIQKGAEAQYDLTTSIHECGGINRFLQAPCMILYKRFLTGQADLEKYILKHISSYSTNPCLFAGITGTVEFKLKINKFYDENRKKSMHSTILFKGHSSRTTITHQILLRNGKLHLFVDQVIKDKTKKKKRKKLSIDSIRGVEKVHETKDSSGDAKSQIHPSSNTFKYVQSRNKKDDEEEKSDIENIDGNASGTMKSKTTELEEEDGKMHEQSISEDETVEEETSPTNMSIDDTKRKNINWKGGSKNCGLYVFLNKYQEVEECVNNVLSYGREHGVLMSGVQLKTLLDIQNVEITKNRASAIAELIANNVEVVSNPHFLSPTGQKPLFEYYGDGSELCAVSPTKSVPIPRTIMIEFREEESKKKKTDGGDKRGKEEEEEESPLEMKKKKDAEDYNSEAATEMMEVDEEKINENQTSSINNKQNNEKEKKKLNESISEEDPDNITGGVDKKGDTSIDSNVLYEESMKNGNILSSRNHLKERVINNDQEDSSDNSDISSTPSPSKIKNVVERCSSPNSGKTDSSITIIPRGHLSSLPPSNCTVSASNQTSPTDKSCSILRQHSNAADNTTTTSPPFQQQSTTLQPKQKHISAEKVVTAQTTSKESKRRSFGLRSKTKKKQSQSTTVILSEGKQNDQHANTEPPAIPSKKGKMNSNKKPTGNYEILTKKVGKIPKKTHLSSATVTSSDN